MVMLGTDMKVAETPKEGLKDYAKTDPYTEWLKTEGVKVHEEFYFPSLAKVELGPWERKGGYGAVAHIDNRHMPNDCHIVEIKPGGKSEPEHHMYELTIYVVSGRGATDYFSLGFRFGQLGIDLSALGEAARFFVSVGGHGKLGLGQFIPGVFVVHRRELSSACLVGCARTQLGSC